MSCVPGPCKINAPKLKCCLATSGYFLVISFMAWLRPIHQDDGWYASFAYNMANDILGTNYSTWDYSVAGYDAATPGFVYSIYQLLFIGVLGPGVLYSKILVVVTASLAVYFMVRFVSEYNQKQALWLPLLLLAWPGFWYHFYNRPEMLAVAMGFAGLCLLARKTGRTSFHVLIAYLLPLLMFDVHPISVFVVFGFYVYVFFSQRDVVVPALMGAFAGVLIYLAGNYVFNRSLGVLSPLFGIQMCRGDHYMPIFDSGFRDIGRIAVERYSPFIRLFAASLLWIPIVMCRKALPAYFDATYRPFVVTVAGFLVLSSLFTEAVSNGFLLYSSTLFFICMFLLMQFLMHVLERPTWLRWAVIIPLGIMLLCINGRNRRGYLGYFQYARYFSKEYPAVGDHIGNNAKVLLRPTFAFALADKKGQYEYSYFVLFYMKANNISFAEAVKEKDYDYIAIDPRDRADMFSDFQRPVYWGGNNWFYNAISNVAIDAVEFQRMIDDRVVEDVYRYDDVSHGKTTFYKVNKELLSQFCGLP